jgi:predicted DCC family thiol-disulfide oxidoreductase YuxK
VLIYDGDCGFCQRSLGWARRLGATSPAQTAAETDLAAYGLTADDTLEAAWFVGDGLAYRGHEAIAMLLRSSRWAPVRWAGAAVGSRALRPVASRVYAWVATHRHLMPGDQVCRVDAPDAGRDGA